MPSPRNTQTTNIDIERERRDRAHEPEQRKREERLVDAADHYADAVGPVADVAVVRQGAGHPVGEHAEAHGPEDEEGCVEQEVEAGREAC